MELESDRTARRRGAPGARRPLAVLGAATLVLATSGCGDRTITYVYPNPSSAVALVEEAQMSGGAAGSMSITVSLAGRDETVGLGTYNHGSNTVTSWLDENTVNICELKYLPTKRSVTLIDDYGERRTISVKSECNPETPEIPYAMPYGMKPRVKPAVG